MTNKKWKDNNLLNLHEAEERYASYLKANYKEEAEKIKQVIDMLIAIHHNRPLTEFYDTNEEFIAGLKNLRSVYKMLVRGGTSPIKSEEEKPYDGQLIYIKSDSFPGDGWIKNSIDDRGNIDITRIFIYHDNKVFAFTRHASEELYDLIHNKYNEGNPRLKKNFSKQEMDLLEDIKTGVYLYSILPWTVVKEWMPAEECYFPSAEPLGANNVKTCVERVKRGEYDILLNGKHKNGFHL